MKHPGRIFRWLLAAALLAVWLPSGNGAKSYSSGGGRTYSSSSSASHSSSSSGSHSYSSGGRRSFSSGSSKSSSLASSHNSAFGGSTRSSVSHNPSSGSTGNKSSAASASKSPVPQGSSSRSFNSSGGKSYSSGSNWSDDNRRGYTASKSYSSGAGHTFSSKSAIDPPARAAQSIPRVGPGSSPSQFTFDTGAARAKKEEISQRTFTQFKSAPMPRPTTSDSDGTGRTEAAPAATPSYQVKPPPIPANGGRIRGRTSYVPEADVLSSRPIRTRAVFFPYVSRPTVIYRDPYNSYFWWWLLDRTFDDRAMWAYHHRYDMDPARYQALAANDRQLKARVEHMEAQQVPRDPNYTPQGLDRDLMYSDRYVNRAYDNRSTAAGVVAFWVLGIPTALGASGFFVWLIWFKRWQTAT